MGLFSKNTEIQEPTQDDAAMYMPQSMEAPPMVSVPYPMLGREKADLMEKIKPEHTIEAIRFKLMGYELKDNVWTKVPYLQEFAISERGAWELTNLIFSVSNQNVSISNLNEEQIKASALDIMNAAIVMMLDYWEEYQINSTSQIRYLSTIIFRTAYITLHQPFNRGIQNLIMGTQQETRTVVDAPMQRKGFMNRLFGK